MQGCVCRATSQRTPGDSCLFLHWEYPSHSLAGLIPELSTVRMALPVALGMPVADMLDAQVES